MTPQEFATEQYNVLTANLVEDLEDVAATPDGQRVIAWFHEHFEAEARADFPVLAELLKRFPTCPNVSDPREDSGCPSPNLADRCPTCLLHSLGVE